MSAPEDEEEQLVEGLWIKGAEARAPCIRSDCSELEISVRAIAEEDGTIEFDASSGLTDVKFILSHKDAAQLRDALDLLCAYLDVEGCDEECDE